MSFLFGIPECILFLGGRGVGGNNYSQQNCCEIGRFRYISLTLIKLDLGWGRWVIFTSGRKSITMSSQVDTFSESFIRWTKQTSIAPPPLWLRIFYSYDTVERSEAQAQCWACWLHCSHNSPAPTDNDWRHHSLSSSPWQWWLIKIVSVIRPY